MTMTNRKRYGFNNPHPDHEPIPGREHTGGGWGGYGRTYATLLRCSCGANFGKISNAAQSTNEGREALRYAYRRHIDEALGQ